MKSTESLHTHTMQFLLHSIGTKRLVNLLLIVFVSSILDIIGIALIFPFLQLISDPYMMGKVTQFTGHFAPPLSNQELIISIGILLVFFYALKSFIQSKLSEKQAQYLSTYTAENTDSIVYKILNARYSVFQNTAASEISGIAYSNTVHTSLALAALIQAFNEALILSFMMIVFLCLNTKLALGSMLLLALTSFLLYQLVIKKSSLLGVEQTNIENIRYRLLFSITTAIRDIKIMGLGNLFDHKNRETSENYSNIAWRYSHNTSLPRFIIEFLALFSVVIVAIITVTSNISSEDATPLLGLLAVATVRAVPAFSRLFNSLSNYKFSSRFVQSLLVLEEKLTISAPPMVKDNLTFKKSIEIKNVSFDYQEKKILDNLSLALNFGESIAIVGPSGAGKSTLLDVFTGLQQATQGEFECDGVKFNPYTSVSIHDLIGYVPQVITLLDETIAFNITFENTPDINKLNDVIKKACLEDLINDLENGLQTKIGENGLRLSGGQRQRVGIARALYKASSILIFDEATSALDAVSEKSLVDEIANLRGNVSTIMVTHKLSNASFCNKIYVINKGVIVSSGKHSDLLINCNLYKQMFLMQQSI